MYYSLVIPNLENFITQFGEDILYHFQTDSTRSAIMCNYLIEIFFELFFELFFIEVFFEISFIASLQSIIHNSHSTTFANSAISLLGRFGGKTRSCLKDQIDLPAFVDTDEHFTIMFPNSDQHEHNMDIFVELILNMLNRNFIYSMNEKTDAKISQSNHCSMENINLLREIRVYYKEQAIRVASSLLYCFCSDSFILLNPLYHYSLSPSNEHLNTSVSVHSIDNRCCSLLLYSLLLGCCDCEIGKQSKEVLSPFIQYLASVVVEYTITNHEHIHFWYSSSSHAQESIIRHVFGPAIPALSKIIAVPTNKLSPLLLAHPLLHLLEREDSFYSDVVIDILHLFKKNLQEFDPEDYEEKLLIFYDYFFSIFFAEYVNGGWRLKVIY